VCHVLIIEDEPLVAMNIEMMLSEIGATSFAFAVTEEEAVNAARDQPPQLITSDVRLGQGHGPAAVKRIHRELGPTPVIFITASPDDCDADDPLATILVKPVSNAAVTAAFHRLVPLP
jgi:CheY-like chemotaxis protein